jgi:hypothetical protein
MKGDSKHSQQPETDCEGCDSLKAVDGFFYCKTKNNRRIKTLKKYGECKDKPNNAQTKLRK